MAICLFCGDCVNPPSGIVDGVWKNVKSGLFIKEDHSYALPPVDGGGPSIEFVEDGEDPVFHSKSFFVLKWLLKIGDDVLRELPGLGGGDANPDVWVKVCESCEPLVNEYYCVLKQILQLQKGLGRIGNVLMRRMFGSRDKTGGGPIWERIRAEVMKKDVKISMDEQEQESKTEEEELLANHADHHHPMQVETTGTEQVPPEIADNSDLDHHQMQEEMTVQTSLMVVDDDNQNDNQGDWTDNQCTSVDKDEATKNQLDDENGEKGVYVKINVVHDQMDAETTEHDPFMITTNDNGYEQHQANQIANQCTFINNEGMVEPLFNQQHYEMDGVQVGVNLDQRQMQEETTEQAFSIIVDDKNEKADQAANQSTANVLKRIQEHLEIGAEDRQQILEKGTTANGNESPPIVIDDDCYIVFERIPPTVHNGDSHPDEDYEPPLPNANGYTITDEGMASQQEENEIDQAERDDESKQDQVEDVNAQGSHRSELKFPEDYDSEFSDDDCDELYDDSVEMEQVAGPSSTLATPMSNENDDHDEDDDDDDYPSCVSNQESEDSMSSKSEIETNSEEDENSMNEPSTSRACSANKLLKSGPVLSLNPCELCNEMFSCELEVEKHRSVHHKVVNYARCDTCNIMFPDHVRLVIHRRQEHSLFVFDQEEIDMPQFPFEAKHLVSKYFCPFESCYEVFHSKYLLGIHRKSHVMKYCYHCPAESSKTHEYAWHELNEHNANKGKKDAAFLETRIYHQYKGIGEVKFHCTRCDWSFEDWPWVIAHFLQSHLKIDCSHFSMRKRPCKCKTCSIWRGMSLPAEEKSSTHACTICKAVFKSQMNLERHMTRFHEKRNKRKQEKNALGKGSKVVLATTSSSKSFKQTKSARECPRADCKKSFTTKAKLTLHMKAHYMQEKEEFMCVLCGMLFRREPALQAHMRRACGSSVTGASTN